MILGGELKSALDAGADRHSALGGGGVKATLAELGIEPEQAQRVCLDEALQWLLILPVPTTAQDVHSVLTSAVMHGVEAGFRLGTLYGGEVPE